MYHGEEGIWTKTKAMRSLRPSCWKTAGALRWGITPLRPRPMSHGLAMMTRTASGSTNGGITAATAPLWNRTLRLYNIGIKQTEAPGLYKYYSTQRPVDIGTFPKPPRNAPDEIVNYDQRIPVENGSFLAWGHLTYTRPLTKRQTSDYELRPAPDNPDRPRSIREQMKTAAKQAEAGISNMGVYMRKMALNGYVLNVDLSDIRELVALQRRCANNLNQVAIHVNTYGGIYPDEIKVLHRDYADLWRPLSDLLKLLSEIIEK